MATRKKPAEQPAPSRGTAPKTAKPAVQSPAQSAAKPAPSAKSMAPSKSEPAKKVAVPKKETPVKKAAEAAPAAKAIATPAAEKDGAGPKVVFSQKFIEAQHKKLLEERARYLASAQTWKAEADSLLLDRDPGDVQFDEESGDGDTLQMERERDLALSSYARVAVEEIDEALARIKAGTYGYCVTSGKPIPKERLEAIPWAAERVEYKVAGFRKK